MSEIDDIFASKGKGKVVSTPIPGPSTSSSKAPPKKRKKKKSNSTGPPSIKNAKDQTEGPLPSSKKRPLPETIVDTSQNVAGPSKRHKGDPEKKSKVDKAAEGEIAGFKDSRGSGSRKTTEEGWLVYKEDELGIRDEGGDTPLCPFDCDCCF